MSVHSVLGTAARRLVLAAGWLLSIGLAAAACSSDEGTYSADQGGSEDASVASNGGSSFGGGTGGTAGSTAATGGSPQMAPTGGQPGQPGGSCNPQFCPDVMGGVPCCVAAGGPCGADFGNGCVSTLPNDAGP